MTSSSSWSSAAQIGFLPLASSSLHTLQNTYKLVCPLYELGEGRKNSRDEKTWDCKAAMGNGTLGCTCSSAGCVLGKPVKLAVCLQMEVDGLQWEHLPSTLVQNKSHSVQTAVVHHLSSSVFMLNIN